MLTVPTFVRGALRSLLGTFFLALAAGGLVVADAAAQDFPTKRITLIVPYAPGGQGDFIGRILSQNLSGRLGQPVVIEHRPSVTGNVGVAFGSKAVADGYTLTLISNQNLVSNLIEGQSSFSITRDLAPVSKIVEYYVMLLVKPSLAVKNIEELVALVKSKPGGVTLGSGGVGSSGHVAMGFITQKTGAQVLHVPYKGEGPLINALLGGEIDMAFITVSASSALVKGGRLRALAVSSSKRLQAFADLPTVGETIPGFEYVSWFGMMVPPGTPRGRADMLQKEIATVLQMPEVSKTLGDRSFEVVGNTPDQFRQSMLSEAEVLAKVIKELGIKTD